MLFGDLTDVATPTTISGALIFVTISLVALVAWILKHVFLTTIPGIVKELGEARVAHDKSIKDIVETFKAESKSERDMCSQKSDVLNASLLALTGVIGNSQQMVISAVNKHTTEAMSAYRHETNDALHEAVLGKELYLLRQKDKKPEPGPGGP